MYKTKTFVSLVVGIALTSSVAVAQPRPDKDWKNWFGHFGGALSLSEGDTSRLLDDGFSLKGGATYWPEDWPIGLVLEADYSGFDVSRSAIDAINDAILESGGEGRIDGGDLSTWSVTASATWSPSKDGSGFYVIAGIGIYRVEGKLKETGLVYYPPVCDPWFWWCYPGGVGPGSIVRASESTTEFGFSGGLGWAFEVGIGSQVYIEAGYRIIDTSPRRTEYLPISIGYRW